MRCIAARKTSGVSKASSKDSISTTETQLHAGLTYFAQSQEVLRNRFGYSAFRGQQQAIINCLCAGGDALVLMPTGGGKSLCYQIPALVRQGTALVISPLIALMQDQVRALRAQGITAAAINSSLSLEQQRNIRSAAQDGDLELLYLAPERLFQPATLAWLQQLPLSLVAIDEAHCVSQWGHDFRPEYMQLAQLPQLFPGVPRVALTATADLPTRAEMVERLGLQQAQQFIHSFDRPNIFYRVLERSGGKDQLLAWIKREHAGEAGIVYCLSRKKTEQIAEWLSLQGVPALPYHAGLGASVREQNQARFLAEDGLVMVATVAFGMGIDKPDVRFVAHLDLPPSIECYYQETGRAGRDGQPADAWMLYGLGDVVQRRRMIEEGEAGDARKRVERQKLDAMLAYAEQAQCRRQALLGYFGEEQAQACGHCDNCLQPPQTWDATQAAQMLLSAVVRTGQRFGATYLVGHLRGEDDPRGERLGHQQLSTFGVGQERSAKSWRSILRQLLARDLLQVDDSGYGSIRLGPQAAALLKGQTTLELREETKGAARASRKAAPAADLSAEDQTLYQSLKQERAELAREAGIPAYRIFHDATLVAMASTRPHSLGELAEVHGVGQAKLEAYGPQMLAVIKSAD
nr:DNA helicase RecQ [Oceanococcus sp. HetDA_MAG_MS8]